VTPGDVVLMDFPFSDLSGSKLRPAVVLSVVRYTDVIVCQVTTNNATGALTVLGTDLAQGKLALTSYVRPERLFTADGKLVKRKIGRLTPAKLNLVRDAVIAIVRGS
jgi:mRNA interferase MazF